jgi:hypothetical protein
MVRQGILALTVQWVQPDLPVLRARLGLLVLQGLMGILALMALWVLPALLARMVLRGP